MRDTRVIVRTYATSSWLLLDAIAAVPVLPVLSGTQHLGSPWVALMWLPLLKLLRFSRMR